MSLSIGVVELAAPNTKEAASFTSGLIADCCSLLLTPLDLSEPSKSLNGLVSGFGLLDDALDDGDVVN